MNTPDRPDAGTSGDTTSTAGPANALPAAKAPVGTGTSPLFALFVAVVMILLGVVGIQEALVRSGALSQTSWTSTAADSVDGITSKLWMLAPSAVVGLLGVLLLVVVIKPRPRKTLRLTAATGVFLHTGDLARMVDSLLEGAEGVTDLKTKVSRRKIRITATTLVGKDHNRELEADLHQRLDPVRGALSTPPKIVVTIRNEDL